MPSAYTHCTLCPRRCGADRTKKPGYCGAGGVVKAARAALHHWEEPCLSGPAPDAPGFTGAGSGTVFFSHCNLQCAFCQNHAISAGGYGKEITVPRLAGIFLELQKKGAHNLNLVTPTPWLPSIIQALTLARPALHIPVVYNTGGYETLQAVASLKGYVDIFVPDLKYVSTLLSARYSGAPDYFEAASRAIQAMCAQTGPPVFDSAGMLQRGVVIRHMVLPGCMADSRAVLDWLAHALPRGGFLLSLMSQYTPCYKAGKTPPLNRRISTYEYRKIVDHALSLGLDTGYMQEKSSAKEEYTPPFDLEGI